MAATIDVSMVSTDTLCRVLEALKGIRQAEAALDAVTSPSPA